MLPLVSSFFSPLQVMLRLEEEPGEQIWGEYRAWKVKLSLPHPPAALKQLQRKPIPTNSLGKAKAGKRERLITGKWDIDTGRAKSGKVQLLHGPS